MREMTERCILRKQSRNSIYSEGGQRSALVLCAKAKNGRTLFAPTGGLTCVCVSRFYENHFAFLISLFSGSFHKTIILNRYYIYKVRGTPRKTSGKSFERLLKVPPTNYS